MEYAFRDFCKAQIMLLNTLVNLARCEEQHLELLGWSRADIKSLSELNPSDLLTLSDLTVPIFDLINPQDFFKCVVPLLHKKDSNVTQLMINQVYFNRAK